MRNHYIPRYSDDKIREQFKMNKSTIEDFRFCQRMRDEYEGILAHMRKEYEELQKNTLMMQSSERALPPQ